MPGRVLISSTAAVAAMMVGWLLLVAGMPAAAPAGTAPADIYTAENDRASWHYLQLDNGLKVILISDSEAERAAASLQVAVGSADDPPEYLGMAHFLEHMLFLGTDLNPEPDSYQTWLSSKGGRYNAYTALEYTNYFFELPTRHLDEMLKRFSRFFIAPTLDPRYIERERNVVHAEYTTGLRDDRRRELDVFKEQANPDHPWTKFTVGNAATLASDNLHQSTRKFFLRHYRAGNMTLTVYGSQPLAELEQWVKRYFAEIAAGGEGRKPITEPLFQPGTLPYMVRVSPERDIRSLTLSFPVADPQSSYRTKPLDYLANLLGHEGTGSLLSLLKRRNWATALVAGGGLRYRGGATLDINISLTAQGQEAFEQVIAAVFAYIAILRRGGIERWRHDEQASLAALNFKYLPRIEPENLVRLVSHNLHIYPPAEVLRGDYIQDDYDPAVIGRFLAALVPENCFVMLTARGFEPERYSNWYKTPYATAELAGALFQSWPAGTASGMDLPAANPFVPDDLRVLTPTVVVGEEPRKPEKIFSSQAVELWYRDNGHFKLPRAITFLRLTIPHAKASSFDKAAILLSARLLRETLNEYSYPALLAGLGFQVRADNEGLVIKISGYDQHQRKLLRKILAEFFALSSSPERFSAYQQELADTAVNMRQDRPYSVLSQRLFQLLSGTQVDEWQSAVALSSISLDDWRDFHYQRLSRLNAELMVTGNLSAAEARAMALLVDSYLGSASGTQRQHTVLELEPGMELKWWESLPHSDSALVYYLQAQFGSWRERTLIGLSAQILGSDFFHQLRTERQLGYIVYSRAVPFRNMPGMVFVVQSPSADVELLQREVEGFLQRAGLRLQGISPQQFNTYREALAEKLQKKPNNIGEQAEEWWFELMQGNDTFDTRQRILSELNALTVTDLQRFATTFVPGREGGRSLVLQTPGTVDSNSRLPGFNRLEQFYLRWKDKLRAAGL